MLRMIIRRLLGAARLTTMRMQQPIPSASKLASGLAADPQHYVSWIREMNFYECISRINSINDQYEIASSAFVI
jgi:hypothetical protein